MSSFRYIVLYLVRKVFLLDFQRKDTVDAHLLGDGAVFNIDMRQLYLLEFPQKRCPFTSVH